MSNIHSNFLDDCHMLQSQLCWLLILWDQVGGITVSLQIHGYYQRILESIPCRCCTLKCLLAALMWLSLTEQLTNRSIKTLSCINSCYIHSVVIFVCTDIHIYISLAFGRHMYFMSNYAIPQFLNFYSLLCLKSFNYA